MLCRDGEGGVRDDEEDVWEERDEVDRWDS